MKARERRYIIKKRSRLFVFENGVLKIPADHYRSISFFENHPNNDSNLHKR